MIRLACRKFKSSKNFRPKSACADTGGYFLQMNYAPFSHSMFTIHYFLFVYLFIFVEGMRHRNGHKETQYGMAVLEKPVRLKREVGLVGGISLIVGTIVGVYTSCIYFPPQLLLNSLPHNPEY